PARLKSDDLEALCEPAHQINARQKDRERRRELDDLGDEVQVIDRKDLRHLRASVHEVVDVLHVMEDDKKDDQDPKQHERPGKQAPDDMEIVSRHCGLSVTVSL